MSYDVAIVGGGLVGAACADALAGEGMRVCLLESGPFAREASWAGAGILHPIHPWTYPEPLQPLLRAGAAEYERCVPPLIERTGIDPELERSGLLLMEDDADRLCAWLGDTVPWRRVRAREADPALQHDGDAVLLPDACHVRSHLLVRAYLASARARGADLFAFRPATEIREGVVGTPRGPIEAERTVLCAGAWSARLRDGLAIEPVRGQILLYRGRARHMVILPDGHYAVPRRDGRLLFGSTLERAGFDGRPTNEAHTRLADAARRALGLGADDLLAAWAGLRPGTASMLPYLGVDPERPGLVHASGHFRNGILLAPLTARIVRDLVLGRDPGFDLAAFRP